MPHRAPFDFAFVQKLGRRLETLVLEQPADERFARILFRILVTVEMGMS
jgi:hypothetical protein